MNHPHAVTAVEHWVGQIKGQTTWRVFTDFHFADGGDVNVADCGPFPSVEAAELCAMMARIQGADVITDDMLRSARRAYLTRPVH